VKVGAGTVSWYPMFGRQSRARKASCGGVVNTCERLIRFQARGRGPAFRSVYIWEELSVSAMHAPQDLPVRYRHCADLDPTATEYPDAGGRDRSCGPRGMPYSLHLDQRFTLHYPRLTCIHPLAWATWTL
jgi:hypothetical protein